MIDPLERLRDHSRAQGVGKDIMIEPDINHVVVMGIWGRGGGDGVPGLIKELTPRLTALGVPASNVFSVSWNPDHNDSPFEAPDTDQHLAEVHARTVTPSYLALIGHSYGGWAFACSHVGYRWRQTSWLDRSGVWPKGRPGTARPTHWHQYPQLVPA